MDLLSARQKLVASNIAMPTPGYKTQDIDFQSESLTRLAANRTRCLSADRR